MGLTCGVESVEGAQGALGFWRLFRFGFGSDCFGFGVDFGRVLKTEAKMVPKSIFGRFFGKLFFERDFASIFHRFWEA